MMARIGRLTAAEFLKLFSQPFLYITLVVVVASTLGAEVFRPIIATGRTPRASASPA